MIIKNDGDTYSANDYTSEAELQQVIFEKPELLRANNSAKLYSIGREISTDAGPLDVLLLDESGKLVVVEVKLSKNGESRRSVVAQIIDYVSALSLYSYFELDDESKGSLDKTVSSLDSPETLRKLIESNLRSGKVRLVIAVDKSNDDLLRIVQFISDHTDFEIDLIEVEKYLLGTEKLYSSNIVMKGEVSVQGQKRIARNNELLESIENKWNADYKDKYPKATHSNGQYRQIRMEGWNSSIHYEFLSSNRNDYFEVRLDNELSKSGSPELRSRLATAMGQFANTKANGYTINYDANRTCKLVIAIDNKDALAEACPTMAALIDKTYQTINKVIEEYKKRG